FLAKFLPKIGPLRGLQFKAPTAEAEKLFLESFKGTRDRYAAALEALARGRLDLPNTDFDTGKPSAHGEYALADETYADLLHRLAGPRFAGVSDALRKNITAFYAAPPSQAVSKKERKRAEEIRKDLAALNGTS